MTTVKWYGKKVTKQMMTAADKGTEDAAEFVLEQANRTIPHETGTMMRSGTVTKLGQAQYAVSYDTPYAVRQHEDTRLQHDPGRRPKWLERTLREEKRRVVKYIGDKVKEAMR